MRSKIPIIFLVVFFLTAGLFLVKTGRNFFFEKSYVKESGKKEFLSQVKEEKPEEIKSVPEDLASFLKQKMPNKEELTDWKTFEAEKFNFKVKYPNNWTAAFSAGDFKEIVVLNSPPEGISTTDTEPILAPKIVISFLGMRNTQNFNLSQAAEAEQKRPVEEGYQLVSQKDIIFKNAPGKELVFSDGKNYEIHYIFLKNENIFRIIAEMFEKDEKLIETFERIFSTFEID